jgi:hypothetical protein
VKKMQVENGVLKFCEGFPGGEDTRWWKGSDTAAVPCEIFPEWTYGCSLAGPIEAFLTIGGYPEVADGLGYEDSVVGFMLKNNGYSPANGLRYDRRMLTYESDELHAQYPRFLREDPCRGDPLAIPRDDMSHALLRLLCPLNSHPGYFGEEGIRGLRRRIQAGNRFSSVGIPEHRWFDSKPLRDLPENPADAIPLPYYDEAKA